MFLQLLLSFFTSCQALSTLVLPITFLSNTGRHIIAPVCDLNTINSLLTGEKNSFKKTLEESSNNTLTLDDITYVPIKSNRYASSLGCITSTYYSEAKDYYISLGFNNFDSFDIRLLILPSSAGGGSCSRALYYSSIKYSFIRSCNIVTVTQAIAQSLGFLKAVREDLSDPMGIIIPSVPYFVSMFHPLNRLKLNGINRMYIKNFTLGKQYISSASLTQPNYTILIKGPLTSDLSGNSYWISYRGWSSETSDKYLPSDYINCVFIHLFNLLESKLCQIGQEFIDAPSGTRISLLTKNNFTAQIEFINCVQRQPSICITKIQSILQLFVFNNNDITCNFTSTYHLLFDKIPIGYNIDGIEANGRKISVKLVLDINPLEIGFEFSDGNGILFTKPMGSLTSGIYSFIYNGSFGNEITFKLFDAGGDGICCQYGGGSYYQILIGNTIIHQGGKFGFVDIFKFVSKPIQIFSNLYPKTYSKTYNLTFYDQKKTSDNIFRMKISNTNSKNGYAIKILPDFNYTFKI